MFPSSSSDEAYAPDPSLFRSLAECPLICPENSCLVDCECRSEDDCPKDFTTILIVASAVVVAIILVSVGCYLYRKEKKENRLAGLQVVQIPRAARREFNDSIANLREDPLDLPVLNNASNDTLANNAQVGIPINIPGSVLSPVEDSNTFVISNNPQAEVELAECENEKPNDISVLKDLTQTNEDHSSSNIIIHKTPLDQQDNFDVIEEKEEESPPEKADD